MRRLVARAFGFGCAAGLAVVAAGAAVWNVIDSYRFVRIMPVVFDEDHSD